MERLPYIDEHSTISEAGPEDTWSALVAVMAGTARSPLAHYARVVGCEPASAHGDWRGELRAGATVPGFAVDEVSKPRRLTLTGRHRFSRYALTFELEPIETASATRLRAETRAAFPGVTGRVYRALVISSGAHRLAVHRLLRRVRHRAPRRA
jgi:hypothetical protein